MSNETRHVGIRVARAIVCCLLSIPFAAPAVEQPSAGDVQALYESRRWFELRDAIAGRRVDPLYEGAVAVAFNQTAAAERALKLTLDRAATPAQANDARGLLAILYLRAGRSGDAARLLDDILAAAPDRVDVAQMRATYGAWRGRPNLRIAARRRASVPCSVDASGVRIPLIVNGQPVRWQLDTGASISVLSAAEARMLGIEPHGPAGRVGDFAGGEAPAQTGVARRVVLGGTELRDVTMLVLPDAQPPWTDAAPGSRGAIGLPMILALGSVHWTRTGTCIMPAPNSNPRQETANMVLDWFTPVTRVQFQGTPLDLMLDTGNVGGSQLWERFAREFAPLLAARGQPGTKRLTQVGGAAEHAVVVLPELRLRVAGFDTMLSPANVFRAPVGQEPLHGNLGLDLLREADAVTIDFRAMSLTLHRLVAAP